MQVCWLSVLSTLLPTDGLVYDRDPPSEDHLESPLKKQRSSCISRRGPISQRHVGSALNQSRLAGSQRIGNASTRSACSSRLPHSTPGRWLGKPGSPDGELKALGRQVPVSNRLQQAVCPVRLSDLQRPAAAVDTDVLIGVPFSHPDHEGRQVQPSRWHRGKHPSRTPVLLVVGGASVKSAAGLALANGNRGGRGANSFLFAAKPTRTDFGPDTPTSAAISSRPCSSGG